jgi:hypothetical protein
MLCFFFCHFTFHLRTQKLRILGFSLFASSSNVYFNKLYTRNITLQSRQLMTLYNLNHYDYYFQSPYRYTYVPLRTMLGLNWNSVPFYRKLQYSAIYLAIYLSTYLSIDSSIILLLDIGRFFNFLILYTDGRTPWTGDQAVIRPLPTHRINAHQCPCLEWDLNTRSQRSSERRKFML